ncbi:DUF4174 domain-containing protein [Algihabitans albus]|uniref:DUF4174 domain-containing protein n=1 Tax=Algihabitans albus TaxID=2164067 RepID=UPI001ABCCB16|nr:DUF4174 domain-containing protein [Algihabitans albus]
MSISGTAAKTIAACFAFILLSGGALAEPLEDYKGKSRLLVVFAPTVVDDNYEQQMQQLLRNSVDVSDRDLLPVEVIGVEPVRVDALSEPGLDPVALRERFDAPDGTFKAVLVGKDGAAKLASETPIPADKLFETIDAMPMRQRELGD